jgi:zinc transporter 11
MALLATLATWAATAAGAAAVFLVPKSMPWRHQRTLLDGSLGFAGGVMLAATYWGLLGPAMEQAQHSGIYGRHGWAPPAIGLILGAALVALADRCLPHAKSTSDGGVEAAAIATVAAHSNELQAPPHDSPLQDETDHTAAAGSASAADATTAAVTAAHQLPPRSLQVMAQHAPHLNSDECREVKLDTDGMEGREAGADEAATADTKGAAGADETASEAHATTQRNNRTRPTVYKIKVSTEQPADLDSAAVKSTPVGTPKTPLALSQLERDASWRRLMLIVMAVTLHNLPVSASHAWMLAMLCFA